MNPKSRQSVFCTNVRVEQKQTVLHYQPETSRPFLRVGFATPNLVPQAKSEYAPASVRCMLNRAGAGVQSTVAGIASCAHRPGCSAADIGCMIVKPPLDLKLSGLP